MSMWRSPNMSRSAATSKVGIHTFGKSDETNTKTDRYKRTHYSDSRTLWNRTFFNRVPSLRPTVYFRGLAIQWFNNNALWFRWRSIVYFGFYFAIFMCILRRFFHLGILWLQRRTNCDSCVCIDQFSLVDLFSDNSDCGYTD